MDSFPIKRCWFLSRLDCILSLFFPLWWSYPLVCRVHFQVSRPFGWRPHFGFWDWLLPPANEVWGKVKYSVSCVKNSVHTRGVPGQVPPLGRYTPHWAGTPTLGRYTPLGRYPPGRYTPWSSACWEIRATSGRYTSYWNTFFLFLVVG